MVAVVAAAAAAAHRPTPWVTALPREWVMAMAMAMASVTAQEVGARPRRLEAEDRRRIPRSRAA